LSEDGWELPGAWSLENRKLDFLSAFDFILDKGPSWSPELALWKSPKHDSDIYAWHKEGVIEELQVRLDLRGDVRSMATKVTEFCAQRELSFLIMDAEAICAPNINSLVDYALNSRAAKYSGAKRI